ncbi:MAG: hypothetical protein M3121_07285 [Chloroflexota bacterium]|nr:hypothetical protein [Chloroflexota bacterium]
MDHRGRDPERVVETHRTTKGEALSQGIGDAAPGVELAVPSLADETGVVDLGVDEPTPQTMSRAEGRASDPTGTYAGETAADRQKEDEGRETLEERFPRTRGEWKESGAMPKPDHDPPQ